MAPSQILLSAVLSSLIGLAASIENCPVQYCGGIGSSSSSSRVRVKFPFQITSNLGLDIPSTSSNPRCGYPRFQLICLQNQTNLLLPRSGPFTVINIDYNFQTLYINDPQNCLPRRYLDGFSLRDSPFYPDLLTNVTFLNCSSNSTSSSTTEYEYYATVPCLSGENYTVFAMDSRFYDESTQQQQQQQQSSSSCEMIRAVMIPVSRGYWTGPEDAIRLTWSDPFCARCEQQGEDCGFESASGLATGCSDGSGSGMSRGAKYAIIIGVGVPGTLFAIGLGCYLCRKTRAYDSQSGGHGRRLVELSNTTITLPSSAIMVAGLDRPTIESYPQTLLGESGRLPKPNDNTCSICLGEYRPKETLRTIPECNHYFHTDCIDKWLRMNASCPVCRNSPEGSSFFTPSTSISARSSSVLSP